MLLIPYSLSVADHKIHQECNGLMLLKSKHIRNSYCVYNLTTRQPRKIRLIKNDDYPYVRGMALAFSLSKSPHYKIICVRSNSSSENPFKEYSYKIEIYDSERRTWKLGLRAFTYPTGVLWNNGICWCTDSQRLSYSVQHLQESNGHLFHVEVSEDRDGFESVTMWELGGVEDHNHKWLLRYHHHSPASAGCVGIVRLVGGSDKWHLLCSRDGKFKAYRSLDNTYEDLVDIPFELLDVFQFGEILVVV